jgi:Ca-activated chloride channel family protein
MGMRGNWTLLLGGAAAATLALAGLNAGRPAGASPMLRAPVPEPVALELPSAPPVDGVLSFTGTLDRGAVLRGGDGIVRMELVVKSLDEPEGTRMPTDLLVVLDRSGSMSGEKIEHARRATRELVGQLGPEDRFALVSYETGVRTELGLMEMTPEARRRAFEVIAGVQTAGGTNMSSGLDAGRALLGQREVGRASRAVLISDGLPNEGDATMEGLTQRARAFSQAEITMTSVGVGVDFNEYLMAGLADAGAGNYYFLEDGANLAEVFESELSTSWETVASGLSITLRPPDGVRVVDAAGYPLTATADGVRLDLGTLYAGQERRIWVTYQLQHGEADDQALGPVALGYTVDGAARVQELAALSVAVEGDRDAWVAQIDADAWGRSVTIEEYNALKLEVAKAVKQRDEAGAKAAIAEYRARNFALNEVVDSTAVWDNLSELDAFEAEMEETFTGLNQAAKQNVFSKGSSSSSYEGRRLGSKKLETSK